MPKVNNKERAFIQPLGLEFGEFGKAQPQLRFENSSWVPEMPPDLLSGEDIGLDFEYVPDDRSMTLAKPFSFSVYSPKRGRGWYVPWGHLGGGNLPKEHAIQWLHNNLKDRDVRGLSVKAEAHCCYNLGVNPARLQTRFHDCAFPATLLREDRVKGFSLESLAEEWLPAGERKVHPFLPPEHFILGHAGLIQERCISDSFLACRIHEATLPQIRAEGLERVNALEDRIILPVTEMERNGGLIDRSKAERWMQQIQNRVEEKRQQLHHLTGIRDFQASSAKHLDRLFAHLGLKKPIVFDEKEKENVESYNWEALAPLAYVKGEFLKGIQCPEIALVLDIRDHLAVISKYLLKYLQAMTSDNVVHFPLHQLRGVKDDNDTDSFGAATGRFSSGGTKWKLNVQQVYKVEDQLEQVIQNFVIRELFIAAEGKVCGASDASQIEFRLFSHAAACYGYWGTAEAYRNDPWIDFHLLVTKLMNPGITDAAILKSLRKHMKHNNFGVLYGMGREKLARRLGLACTCGYDWHERYFVDGRERMVRYFKDSKAHHSACPGIKANAIMDEYDQKFPEARFLSKRATDRAKQDKFIKTMLGRVRHFPCGEKAHKAFNSWDQGTAADYFKTKLDELWSSGLVVLRAPVHDEFVYDVEPDPVIQSRVEELLNTQSWKLHVPLLWATGYGANWREANEAS